MEIHEYINGWNFSFNLLTKEFKIYQVDGETIILNPDDAKSLFEMIDLIQTKGMI